MLIHTVFFWLKNAENEADSKALHDGLSALRKINLIHESFVGVPANTNREVIDSSYQYSLTFIFKTAEDQDAYQSHPDHLVFIKNCSHLWERVKVYDVLEM